MLLLHFQFLSYKLNPELFGDLLLSCSLKQERHRDTFQRIIDVQFHS